MTSYLSEAVGAKERLQYGIRMGRRAPVFQSNISGFLL